MYIKTRALNICETNEKITIKWFCHRPSTLVQHNIKKKKAMFLNVEDVLEIHVKQMLTDYLLKIE